MNGKRRVPWLVLFFSLVLALAATGCGGSDDNEGSAGGGGDTGAATESGATEGGASDITVGLITDIGGINDRGFNQLAFQGLKRAETELGIKIRVLESKSDADYIPNLSTLAEEGVDLSISVGFLTGEATEQAANEFPDINFAIIDFAYEAPPSNLQGLVFKEQETGYLVGYMAGLVTMTEGGERTNAENVVSSVGGQKIPPVDRFIAGFQKGAKDANPDVTTINGYSQDFIDQAKCKEVALDQISRGSDVVFQVAGGCGLGTLDAASEKNVWGIGVDSDQGFIGPQVMTSSLKRVDEAVFQTVQAIVDGSFEGGGVSVFGLEEDGVGLGEVSPDIPQDIIDQVEAQRQKIIDGEIEIPDTVE